MPAKKLVAALTMPNATMNVSVDGERGEAELVLGEQRQDGAFLADHAADERVDADEQRELGEVLAQAEPDAGRVGGAVVVIRRPPDGCPVAVDQVSGPPSRTRRSR